MAKMFNKVELLGSGTFGRAWLVKNASTGKCYVCKEVTVSGMTEKAREQSLTEVAALAKCKHLNVIRYRQAFVDKGMLNIVMEYANSGDLQQKIEKQRGKLFKEDIIIDWFVQICFALRYIHRLNILHRDLKTQNIFVTSENLIKIGDFGIARILQNTDDHAQTAIGTPFYLSPEICQQLPYSFKSDMWAAGCVLYELCSLQHPFEAPNLSGLIMKILHGTYSPIPSIFGALLVDLIQVLLSVDVDGRPSAEQVLCIPAIQSYINKYVERTMSQKAIQPKVITPQAPKPSATDDISTNMKAENKTPPCLVASENTLKRTYSLDSLQSNPDSSDESTPGTAHKISEEKKNIEPKDKSIVSADEKENASIKTRSKRIRRMSLLTPSPVEKLRPEKEISSARCQTPPHKANKHNLPRMSLYKEVVRRKALKEIQKRAPSSNTVSNKENVASKTYTIARSHSRQPHKVGLISELMSRNASKLMYQSPLTKESSTDKINRILYEHFCLNTETIHQTTEALCASLESEIGEEPFVSFYHTVKEGIRSRKSYSEIIETIKPNLVPYFPIIHHLLQMETIGKQSIL